MNCVSCSIRRSVSQPVLFSCQLSPHWFCRDWITTALLWLISLDTSWTNDRQSVLNAATRSVGYTAVESTTVFHRCCATFSGCVSLNALNFVRLFSHTWQETYNGQLPTTFEGAYTVMLSQRRLISWLCVGLDLQRLVIVLSASLHLLYGMTSLQTASLHNICQFLRIT